MGFKPINFENFVQAQYFYQPVELEGGRCWATDPIWSLTTHRLVRAVAMTEEPVIYYWMDGPQ